MFGPSLRIMAISESYIPCVLFYIAKLVYNIKCVFYDKSPGQPSRWVFLQPARRRLATDIDGILGHDTYEATPYFPQKC